MIRNGRVVKIRVNPTDCMGVIDLLRVQGVIKEGMSFATAVSTALFYLLKAARESQIIPVRGGFEFAEMMQPFSDQPHLDRTRKLAFTNEFRMSQLPSDDTYEPENNPSEEFERAIANNPEIRRLESRQREIAALKAGDPLQDYSDEIVEIGHRLAELYKAEQR